METSIVRIWTASSDGEPSDGLRGIVRHVRSGRELRFGGVDQLCTFLTDLHADAPEAPSPTAAPGET